jgi:hypothetical protein
MSVIHLFQIGCLMAVPIVLLFAGAIAVLTAPTFIWRLCQMQADSPLKLLYERRSAANPGMAEEWVE